MNRQKSGYLKIPTRKIGSGAKIFGNGCSIGSNVVIQGSYIWNNVTVEDGCEIRNAVVCDGVKVSAGSIVQAGVVLSFKVVVGRDFVVPAYSKGSLLQQPMEEDSDEENLLSGVDLQMESKLVLGHNVPHRKLEGILSYIWQVCDEGWKHSVAPIPKDKLAEIIDDDDTEDESVVTPSGDANRSINNDVNGLYDFEIEVDGTFLRAVEENIVADLAVLEINSLRLSYNMESAHCAGAIFYSMMKLAADTPHSSAIDLYKNAASIITRWKGLLGFYVKQSDEQIEVISRLEEMCQESAQELGPLFAHIIRFMYEEENDILQEVAILRWADEKAGADESDKVYLKQCEPFITWLKETSDDEDD
ncbi:W2 domain [Arabidopsis thaliana x Arabidopsis arenosa]|uniref:Translation initiation factor eIF2B subunit epsilon n=1 Tax=Arabidopsis thaliana x Arabidopsis arenosa TaxID=1240361 RepID=A0A8T2AMB9_9BRAS|nr:W2 domain [Arabidopsis thaliana x Arabidopsis arenosa]